MAVGTTVAKINAVVTANTTQFTGAMTAAEKKAQSFTSKAGALSKKMSGPVTLALLGAAAAAVAAGTEFESSMKKIESLVGLSAEAVDGMTDSVKALASETGRGPKELADAMFFITSAGLRGQVALDTLEASAKAAAVGLGDTATIADLATSALNAYGSDVLSAADATDVMVAAVREGKLDAEELAGSMGKVLPIASAMGVSFNEVGAAFAALSRTGTNAAEAATQVRGIMSSLLRPTKQAEEALTGMGLSSEGLRQQLKQKGLLATLKTLSDKFDGNSAAAASVFGNIRALSGVMDLMGANVEGTEAIFASMTDTTGMLDEAFKITAETTAFKFQTAMAEAKKMLVDLGEAIIPIAVTMLEGIRSLVGAFAAMPGPLKLAAGAMVAFVVASGPIGQIAIAVGGLAYLIGQMGQESRDAKARQESLTDEFIKAGDPAATMIERMTELAGSINDVGDAADGAVNPVGDLIGSSTMFEEIAKRGLIPALDNLQISLDDMTEVVSSGTDVFQQMEHQIKDGLDPIKTLDRALVGATGSELDLITAMKEGIETDNLSTSELLKLLDALDETADAFDDQRATIEQNSKAFIQSATTAALLSDAGYDSVRMLAAWEEQGKSYTQQALLLNAITRDITDSMIVASPEAMRFGIEIESAAADLVAAQNPMIDITELTEEFGEAIEEAGGKAQTFKQKFEDMMGAVVFEGEALNNTQLLLADMEQVFDDMSEQTLPEMQKSFYDMTNSASGQLGELVDAGLAIGGPEMGGATESMFGWLAKMATEAGIPLAEFLAIHAELLAMAGMEVPVKFTTSSRGGWPTGAPVKLDLRPEALLPMASGGIVSRPTAALIGEAGPEAVVPLSSAPGRSALSGGMGVTNITINMPVGSSGDDIIRSLRNNERLNGSIPITPMAGLG